jgi:hypothetical protein
MLIAKIENNEIKLLEHREAFPNTSFPNGEPDLDFIRDNNYLQVISWENFDSTTEKLVDIPPYLLDGLVYIFRKELKTAQEIASELEAATLQMANNVREQRNRLLRDSDWTQTKDSPDAVDVLWQPYRQALRDITTQEGFPFNVVWPIAP